MPVSHVGEPYFNTGLWPMTPGSAEGYPRRAGDSSSNWIRATLMGDVDSVPGSWS